MLLDPHFKRSWSLSLPLKDRIRFHHPALQDVLSCKSIFDKLESHELMKARARSNPYETIAKEHNKYNHTM